MKKIGYWLLSVVLAVVCLCAVVGCGGSKAGTYKFESITVLGQTIKAGEEYNVLGSSVKLSKDALKIELKKDGTCVITAGEESFDSAEGSGTWEEDENDDKKVNIKIGDAKVASYYCDGKEIHLDLGLVGNFVLKK